MEEDHYDTPWEFLARPTSMRLSAAEVRLPSSQIREGQSLHESPSISHSPSISNNLVHIGNSPIDSKRLSLRAGRAKKLEVRNEEDVLLERNIGRVEAEKRLEGRSLGDFLLRSRGEGSAALSLRGSNGVLHIKLERRGEKWVIGEGPCFRSISSAIHYYRRHPLPIRGADHLLLNRSLTQAIKI